MNWTGQSNLLVSSSQEIKCKKPPLTLHITVLIVGRIYAVVVVVYHTSNRCIMVQLIMRVRLCIQTLCCSPTTMDGFLCVLRISLLISDPYGLLTNYQVRADVATVRLWPTRVGRQFIDDTIRSVFNKKTMFCVYSDARVQVRIQEAQGLDP